MSRLQLLIENYDQAIENDLLACVSRAHIAQSLRLELAARGASEFDLEELLALVRQGTPADWALDFLRSR